MGVEATKHVDEVRKANKAFQELGTKIQQSLDEGNDEFDLREMASVVGVDVDEKTLARLDLPPKLIAHPFVSWQEWFPWRQLWLLYWAQHQPETDLGASLRAVHTLRADFRSPVRLDLNRAFAAALACP